MAASSLCSFVLGGSSATINGVDGGTDLSGMPQWVTSLSMGLTRRSQRGSNRTVSRWSLRFDSLTAAMQADLEAFFLAVGPAAAFTYTHTDGVAYSARFAQAGLQWTRYNADLWGTSVTLEVL